MAEKKARKKRFTFADAKLKIKELESQIEALNVDLSDNIVTEEELKILKLYKVAFFFSLGGIMLLLAMLLT